MFVSLGLVSIRKPLEVVHLLVGLEGWCPEHPRWPELCCITLLSDIWKQLPDASSFSAELKKGDENSEERKLFLDKVSLILRWIKIFTYDHCNRKHFSKDWIRCNKTDDDIYYYIPSSMVYGMLKKFEAIRQAIREEGVFLEEGVEVVVGSSEKYRERWSEEYHQMSFIMNQIQERY